ncbi:MAG: hypothetical protein CMJ48_13875 [Planctomycetaceae bacterium]|nr:hypothetical protein [Planctomycetaceae bacterium]
MRRLIAAFCLGGLIASTGTALAQQPYDEKPVRTRMTDSEMMIFRRAVARAQQRTRRIAARKWFQHSPQRPVSIVSPVVHNHSYYESPFAKPFSWYSHR